MPRANRHFLPGLIWHLTHRCHERTSLLKFAQDRARYLRWLYEARKRFGLCVLKLQRHSVARPEIGNSEKLTCWTAAIWLLASSVGLLIVGSTAAADNDIPDVNPMSGDETAIAEGRSWFRGICSACHSEGASSRNAPVDLRKFNRGFRQFVLTVRNGRRVPGRVQYMPAWGTVLSEKQIYQIGAYLETLALPEANWKEPLKSW